MEEDRYIRITLRMPRGTHLLLSNAAEAKTHSMNAEIVSRLESSFKKAPAAGTLADDYLQKIEALLDRKLEPLLKQVQS
ncbi:MAG: Arc family DNA-binding protein [Polaromonas sp.]|nr:Arc family DNA-binding protein [Polaromonas sp.]